MGELEYLWHARTGPLVLQRLDSTNMTASSRRQIMDGAYFKQMVRLSTVTASSVYVHQNIHGLESESASIIQNLNDINLYPHQIGSTQKRKFSRCMTMDTGHDNNFQDLEIATLLPGGETPAHNAVITSHVMSRRATTVTRRVGSGSEAQVRCPKDVKIVIPLRGRHGHFHSQIT
jgi:hypothetical protein